MSDDGYRAALIAEELERAFHRLAEDARKPLEPNASVIHPDDVEAYERHYGREGDAQ